MRRDHPCRKRQDLPGVCCIRVHKQSNLPGLRDSDPSFLLVPKERKFDPFGESLRGKLRRLVTGSDGLNNRGSQERQPNQPTDVIREDPFTLSYHCNRFHSTRKQIVSPLASPSDRLHERQISGSRASIHFVENPSTPPGGRMKP